MKPLYLLFILSIFILFIQGCDDESKNSSIISIDPVICLDQTAKNSALWNYMDDWYLWNETLDNSIQLNEFVSLELLLENIKERNPIDRFSLIMTKDDFDNYFIDASNVGYGMGVKLDELNNELVVSLVYEFSSAQEIGLSRGDRIIAINGLDLHQVIGSDTFEWSGFWAGIDITQDVIFTWRTLEGHIITKAMKQRKVTTNTIFATKVFESSAGRIGYLVYNSFIDPSSEDLNQAFSYFKDQNVDELIVDLRYNHGGTSRMSNQLASQIGGDIVAGHIYNKPKNNVNHQSDIELFNLNGAEHYLNMSRVVFVTTEESASGSEVLINSLKPYLDVKLVGQKTYGKPVGMKVSQLCDQMVLAITHHNHNADGYGDFFAGIPVDCPAIDTVSGEWGSLSDPMLSEAIYLLENNQCSKSQTSANRSLKSLLKRDSLSGLDHINSNTF
jgi:C-terminal processing protease CtpA/Prc